MDIFVPTRPKKSSRWRGWFDCHWEIGGEHFHDVAENTLFDQGEQDLLETFFRAATAPLSFAVGLLRTGYIVTETHTMANMAVSELDGSDGGYTNRQRISRDSSGWPLSLLNGGDWQITSAQVTWTATGPWTHTAGFMFLMSDGSLTPGSTDGRLIAVAPLSPTRQLQAVNDVVRATYSLKLQ